MSSSAQSLPANAVPAARPAQMNAPEGASQEITVRRVVAFIAMVFGMFMAILDIQIVSASLAEIQAGLSASADEIPWVQTSYLIAEVIMIPLSGFLSRAISTRYLFVISAAGFTLMSILCSTATSIQEMILWRALQGFIGGAMIPDGFCFRLFNLSRQQTVDHFTCDRARRNASPYNRADRWRLSDRPVFLALAVFDQCCAGHYRNYGGVVSHRFR